MKHKCVTILKWLVLFVCLLAAGIFYSFHGTDSANKTVTMQTEEKFSTEAAAKAAAKETDRESGEDITDLKETETGTSSESETEDDKPETVPLYYVYVCGEVISPGVYRLPEDARIFEAVDQAGGFTDQAAESWLNLAEPVTDGMKLEVPSKTQVKDPAWLEKNQSGSGDSGQSVSGAALAASKNSMVNINTASLEELMTLKGIGQSRAEDILRYRKEAGGFSNIEDIMKVPGIKDAAFQKIKENITV